MWQHSKHKDEIWHIILLIILVVSAFCIGRKTASSKIERKREIVYDLTQAPEAIEAYYNVLGKISFEKTEWEEIKLKQWGDGFREGYQEAIKYIIFKKYEKTQ